MNTRSTRSRSEAALDLHSETEFPSLRSTTAPTKPKRVRLPPLSKRSKTATASSSAPRMACSTRATPKTAPKRSTTQRAASMLPKQQHTHQVERTATSGTTTSSVELSTTAPYSAPDPPPAPVEVPSTDDEIAPPPKRSRRRNRTNRQSTTNNLASDALQLHLAAPRDTTVRSAPDLAPHSDSEDGTTMGMSTPTNNQDYRRSLRADARPYRSASRDAPAHATPERHARKSDYSSSGVDRSYSPAPSVSGYQRRPSPLRARPARESQRSAYRVDMHRSAGFSRSSPRRHSRTTEYPDRYDNELKYYSDSRDFYQPSRKRSTPVYHSGGPQRDSLHALPRAADYSGYDDRHNDPWDESYYSSETSRTSRRQSPQRSRAPRYAAPNFLDYSCVIPRAGARTCTSAECDGRSCPTCSESPSGPSRRSPYDPRSRPNYDHLPTTSFGTAPGDDISPSIRDKISKDMLINFADIFVKESDNGQGSVTINANSSSFTITKPKSQKPLTFLNWSKCFRSFMIVYLETHTYMHTLTLLRDMLTYHDTVQELYSKGGQWWDYDMHFRKLMSASPFRWSTLRIDLIWHYSGQSSLGMADHKTKNYNSAKDPQSSTPYGFCRAYHSAKGCNLQNCKYKHYCYLCEDKHSVIACTKKSANKTAAQYDCVTPINANKLEYLLQYTKYDKVATQFLINGFRNGFKIGHYEKPASILSNTDISDEIETDIIKHKIDKELNLGRIAGPFSEPPFPEFQLSPIFLRPKSTPGEFRIILDLSYPKNDNSVNSKIDEKFRKVEYSHVGDAIKILNSLHPGAFSCKIDIKDAFRLIPICPADQCKLCFQVDGQYYYEKVLPQGCGSSCYLFEKFACALQHVFQFFAPHCKVLHYLDDFLFLSDSYEICKANQKFFTSLCEFIGVPLAPHKITEPSNKTVYLGVLLDSVEACARLPIEKVRAYIYDIEQFRKQNYVTEKQLQSIIGKLNFAAAVVPGRAFLRRLIDLLPKNRKRSKIYLTKSAHRDLATWLTFLQNYNGCTFFRSLRVIYGPTINLQSDASKQGFGGTFQKSWIQGAYPPSWQSKHITLLELYPLYILLAMYGTQFAHSVVTFLCDNEAVCYIVNKLTCREKLIMFFVRKLVLLIIKLNIDIRAQHVRGIDNDLCDAISRFQTSPRLLSQCGMNLHPDSIPATLLPTDCLLKMAETS